jgi:ADP-ribose pyrophosphatase YjhB (NUDIX family)
VLPTFNAPQSRETEPHRGARALVSGALRLLLPLIKLRTRLRGISLGVRVCVRDEGDRILLIRHSYLPGWHFPGGGVEVGETAAQAAQREVAEEGGVETTAPLRLVGVFRNPEWSRGDHVAYFEAGAWRPCARKWGVEIEATGFFAENQLPPDVHPSVRRRLAERRGGPINALW